MLALDTMIGGCFVLLYIHHIVVVIGSHRVVDVFLWSSSGKFRLIIISLKVLLNIYNIITTKMRR